VDGIFLFSILSVVKRFEKQINLAADSHSYIQRMN
jgi:hypothetical protein